MTEQAETAARDGHFLFSGSHVHAQTFMFMLFFMFLSLSCAIWARLKISSNVAQTADSEGAYFLAGRSFGPWILFLTIFSTTFNGTLVVWLPAETAWFGLENAARIGTFIAAVHAASMIGPAFRVVGAGRRHSTLGEFYTDRYRSNTVTFLLLLVFGISQLLVVSMQLTSVRETVEALVGNMEIANYFTVFLAFFILICEMIGGFGAIAVTDAFQAAVLILMYIISPMIVISHWYARYPSPMRMLLAASFDLCGVRRSFIVPSRFVMFLKHMMRLLCVCVCVCVCALCMGAGGCLPIDVYGFRLNAGAIWQPT
jgi:Na+/proline symporter